MPTGLVASGATQVEQHAEIALGSSSRRCHYRRPQRTGSLHAGILAGRAAVNVWELNTEQAYQEE